MDLIIGGGSQLVSYFDKDNTNIISSRNVDKNYCGFNNVILTFAEQRTLLNLKESDFIDVNVNYTLKLIDLLTNCNNKIIVLGTSELWNGYHGPVNINLPFKYIYSPYIKSKELLYEKIEEKRSLGLWKNVFMIHPFNFNTPYRNKGFVFGKIFDSIINKKKIDVGNLNIKRDIIHPKLIVNEINNIKNDLLIGSGRITNVKNFVLDLYKHYNLNFGDYVTENNELYSPHSGIGFWSDTKKIYTNLIDDTIIDINKFILKNNL